MLPVAPSGAVSSSVPPSYTVTDPVGVPVPGRSGATVTVIGTGRPSETKVLSGMTNRRVVAVVELLMIFSPAGNGGALTDGARSIST
ncbi:IPT/TIG domain-containing protein [Saccharomonospora xinjiangensis]|nr:hypothetical protein EYD13_16865 [Saccharomonospora xinjiangensis]